MTCLITSYHLNLNSPDYRDSCYVTWFGASFCIATFRQTLVTLCHTLSFKKLFVCVHRLLRNYAKACPESCDITLTLATVSKVWWNQIQVVTCDQTRQCTRQYPNLTRQWLIASSFGSRLLCKSRKMRHVYEEGFFLSVSDLGDCDLRAHITL